MSTVVSELMVKIAADAAGLRAEMASAQNAVGQALGGIKTAMVGLLAGVSLVQISREFVQMADALSLMDARLKLATGSGRDFEAAQKAIYAISQTNNADLQATTALYTKLFEPVKRLGGGVKENTAIVEAFSASLRVGGANTQEAASATLQFAQAMGSGKLNGDEFRAIAEASPRFMKALADGMGVPIEKLKEMGSEGKLTADVVGNALMKSLGELRAEAAQMPDTVGGAFQRLKNDIVLAVGEVNKLTGATTGLAEMIGMTSDIVKAVVAAFVTWQKATQGIGGEIDIARLAFMVFGKTLETFVLLASDVKFMLTSVGQTIGGVAAMIAAVISGDFEQAGTIRKQMVADMQAQRAELDKFQRSVSGVTDRVLQQRDALKASGVSAADNSREMAGLRARFGDAEGGLRTLRVAQQGLTDDQKKAAEGARKYLDALNSQIVALGRQINVGRDLTAAEKEHAKLTEQLRTGKLQLTKAQEDEARAKIDLIDKLQREITERKELEQRQIAAAQAQTRLREAQDRETEALAKSNAELREQNATLGMNEAQVAAREAAVLRARATDLEWQAATEGGNRALEEQARLLRERAGLLQDGVVLKEAQAAREEWQKTVESINNGLTDALMRAFESGKGFAQAFKDTLVNAFKTMVLQPTIKAILAPVAGALGSVFSPGAMASSGGAGGSLMGSLLGGGGSSGGGLMALLNGSAIKSAFGDAAAFGADSLGSWLVNNTTGSLNSLGGSLMANAGGIGTAAGYLGSAGIGYMVGSGTNRLLSGGYQISKGQTIIQDISSAVAGAFLGPLGSAIAGGMAGLANRAFGRKPAETTERGFTGSLSGGTASGQMYEKWVAEGGWFRSDKSGTNTTALDSQLKGVLDSGATAILETVRALATDLGLNTQRLRAARLDFSRTLSDNEEDNRKAIEGLLEGYAQTVTGALGVQLVRFKKDGESLIETLQRLTVLNAFSEQMATLGGIFGKVAGASIQARENIIGLAGGIEALMEKAGAFVRDYYSKEEQGGLQAKAVLEALNGLGLNGAVLDSRADFRALVESLNVNSERDQERLVALLDIAPEFAKLADYLQETNQTLAQAAQQAPQAAILDKLLPDQNQWMQSMSTGIRDSNVVLGQIHTAISQGNISIETGLRAMQDANNRTMTSIGDVLGRVVNALQNNLSSAQPSYVYNIGGN